MAFDILSFRMAGQTFASAEMLVGLLELCSGLENRCYGVSLVGIHVDDLF